MEDRRDAEVRYAGIDVSRAKEMQEKSLDDG